MMESSQLQGMTYLGRFLSYLFQELNENNLPYCVLRNHDLLPNHTDNDVDILIEQRHVALCVRTALKIAEEQELILLRCQRRLGIVKLWLVSTVNISSQEDPEVIIIDFWSSALWRGTPIADMQYVLSSQQVSANGIKVAAIGPSAAVSLTKELWHGKGIGNSRTANRNMGTIVNGVKLDRIGFFRTLEPIVGKRVLEQMIKDIEHGDFFRLENRVWKLRVLSVLRSLTTKPVLQIRNWISYTRWQIIDMLLQPSGIMIGFIGPDGSGKTTITQKLAERVNYSLNNIFPSIIYYHGRFGVLPEVKQAYNAVASRLKLPIKRRLTIEESTQLLDSSPHSPIRTAVYLLYYIIDYLIGHFILAKHRSRGEILTFDRYVYDFLIHKTYGRIPLRLRRFIADLAPQPNLLIFLEGSPNTIHQRKPELRVDQIIEQQAMCKKIITKNENFGVTCSVNGSAQVTLECVFLHMISTLEAQSLNKLRDFLSDD